MQKRPRDKSNRYSPYMAAPGPHAPPIALAPPPQFEYMPQQPRYSGMPVMPDASAAAAQAAAAAYSNYYGMYLQQQGLPPAAAAGGAAPGAAPEELKVSQTSTPQAVAGKIAADCRGGTITPLVGRGMAAVNTTTKAIAIAISFLAAEKTSLCVSPYHKNDGNEESGRSVVFYLKKQPADLARKPPTTIMKVTKNSKAAKLAGGIAAKVRQGEVIAMQAIGPASVQCSVDAFVQARRFLKADSNLDITFTPQFVTVPIGEKTASAIYFSIDPFTRSS